MRTRAEIYGKEAAELLREISMYPGILEGQLCCFHPDKEDAVRNYKCRRLYALFLCNP